MIIGKNFYITEMPKTGTTFLRNYFKQYKNVKITNHHDTLDQNHLFKLSKKKYKIGTIRNPYLWYFSLWKWSCKKKKLSPIFSDLTSKRIKIKRLKINKNLFKYILGQLFKNRNEISNIFSDINSKNNFNKFLEIILKFEHRSLIGSDYSFISHKNLGFMTYNFLVHNVPKNYYKNLYNNRTTFSSILKNLNKKLELNYFFKTENLNRDLKLFLKKNNMKIKKLNKLEKNSTASSAKFNLKNLITKKNLKLIEKKESYLFKKFNYKKISNFI
tara:strand:+ start:1103 stop:1918 length:816 start_codon:yes stop_codon:yes gene_type:complete